MTSRKFEPVKPFHISSHFYLVLWCQFHQRSTRAFFVQKLRFGSFSSYVSALAPKFRTINARVNVDEIDTWSLNYRAFCKVTEFDRSNFKGTLKIKITSHIVALSTCY